MTHAETKTASLAKDEKKFIDIEGEKVVEGSKEHSLLSQEFEPFKKYVFELATQVHPRRHPVMNVRTNRPVEHRKHTPVTNLVFTSGIIWNGRRRMIRYYDGCDTIFMDKQPKEKEIIDMMNRQTRRREFIDGKFIVEGVERMLLLYLLACSYNAESPFKTPRSYTKFAPVDSEMNTKRETAAMDETEKALELAKKATYQKMRIHGAYLGVPLMDFDSQNEYSEAELRIKYRKKAFESPGEFLKSYGNQKIEIQFFINKALENGIITSKLNPNRATWGSNNKEICDISGLKSPEAISQRLFEFSQTEEGTEFLTQLKAVAENF